MSFAWKKFVNKRLREAGVKAFDVAAVNRLVEHLEGEANPDDGLIDFIRAWKQDGDRGDRLTLESVEATLAQLGGSLQQLELFAVINAFEIPKLSYDPVGRKLYEDPEPRSIFASAQAKQQLYMDRLNLVSQRIRRGAKFQPQVLAGGSGVAGPQLTDIQSLKGAVGSRKFVVGCISRSEDGRHVLEDGSGTVPLDLSKAEADAGFYTENCLVVVTGRMRVDGVFKAASLEFPSTESRDNLPMAAQRLNFFGGPALSMEDRASLEAQEFDHMDDRLVVLSNVPLDLREVLIALNTLFMGYNELEQVPAMFVLMGNFHSRASSKSRDPSGAAGADVDYATVRDGFSALAALIDQYPRIKADSRFVFVPGPDDTTCSSALPQAPLPAYFTSELRKMLPSAIFTTNPCRIRYLTKEIVLFRYDILSRMRRRCLIPPKDLAYQEGLAAEFGTHQATTATQQTQRSMWQHLALTLLQQSHLCPLPLLQQPIMWQYDHALHLYPLPHAVIVADGSMQEQYTHEGCQVINPGSFAEGVFSSYKPCSAMVEFNELPKDGQLPDYEEEEEEMQEDGAGSQGAIETASAAKVGAMNGGRDETRDVDYVNDQDGVGPRHDTQGASPSSGGNGSDRASPGAMDVDGDAIVVPAAHGDSSDFDSEAADDPPDADLPASKRLQVSPRQMTDQEAWDAVIAEDEV